MEEKTTLKQQKMSKLRVLFISGVVLLITSFSAVALIVVKSIKDDNRRSKDTTVKLDGISPDIVESLTQQLVYANNDEGMGKYYSPSLDALLNYPESKFDFTDSTYSVSLSIKNNNSLGVYGNIKYITQDEISSYTDINSYLEEYYKGLYSSELVKKNVSEGIHTITVKYQRKDYLDKQKTIDTFRNTYSRKIDDKRYLVLDLQYNNTLNIDSYNDDLFNLVKNAEIAPQNIGEDITVQVKDLGLEISLNRKKWNVQSQSDSYVSIDFRNRENEVKEELKSTFSSMSITGRKAYGDEEINEDYLKERIADSISFSQDKEKFTIITRDEKKTFAGIDFYRLSYSYEAAGVVSYQSNYYGYNKSAGAIVEIRTFTNSLESEGSKAIDDILANRLKPISQTQSGKPQQKTQLASFTKYNPILVQQATSTKLAKTDAKKGDVLGTSTAEIDKSAILGKPAVVHIFNKTCVDIEVKKEKSLKKTGGKTYNVCSAGFGTGFFVNKDGYLITNSHVANPNLVDAVIQSAYDPSNEFVNDFISDLDDILASEGVSASNDEFFAYFVQAIIKSVEDEVMVLTGNSENFVESTEKFDISAQDLSLNNEEAQLKAETISAKEIDSNYEIQLALLLGEKDGIKIPDLTLLKVESPDGTDFPALELADPETINVGQQIQAIGYPGAADNTSLFADSASLISTITKGNISAIKPNFNNQFELIQIDASISPGNSGGPIINAEGEVVGVATYGVSQENSADFNAGVSVEEVIKILDEQGIENEIGQVSENITEGISNFGKEYYKSALEDFSEAKNLYEPASDVLDPLIKISEAKIEAGEDKTPFVSIGSINLSTMQVVVVLAMLCLGMLSLFVILLALVVRFMRRRRALK